MDSVTQAVLGASIQGSLLGKWQKRKALLYGAALATLPDLDVVIRHADPVSAMTHHRGFSHSLLVLTAFSILLTWLIRRWKPQAGYSALRLWLTLWLVLVTHALLDAFTSYGTQLWWPFTPTPASWSTVFIIDPLYTLPLLVPVFIALILGVTQATRRALGIGLAISVAYLGFSAAAKTYIETRTRAALAIQNISWTHMFSAAAPFNTLLWRVIAKDDAGNYYETITGLLDANPPKFVQLPLNLHLRDQLESSPQHERLRWFTNDWLRYDTINGTIVVTDLRMGVAGYHFFRFAMATKNDDGWHVITPRSWRGNENNERPVRLLLTRIWNEETPIPLAEWAQSMDK